MKLRLDILLVEKGLAASRHQAAALILAGRVSIGGKKIEKAGSLVEAEAPITIEAGDQFVGRGGVKLNQALSDFRIDPRGKVCLDLGASTGGFTDCLLQHGAGRVYAVDVGYGQFHTRLRSDPRVVLMEKTNARYLPSLPEPIDLIVADLSFISLTLVLPAVVGNLRHGGELLVLVKPQFELSPKEVKKGVVRDDALRNKAVEKVAAVAETLGLKKRGESASILPGPKGNREIFLLLQIE